MKEEKDGKKHKVFKIAPKTRRRGSITRIKRKR